MRIVLVCSWTAGADEDGATPVSEGMIRLVAILTSSQSWASSASGTAFATSHAAAADGAWLALTTHP